MPTPRGHVLRHAHLPADPLSNLEGMHRHSATGVLGAGPEPPVLQDPAAKRREVAPRPTHVLRPQVHDCVSGPKSPNCHPEWRIRPWRLRCRTRSPCLSARTASLSDRPTSAPRHAQAADDADVPRAGGRRAQAFPRAVRRAIRERSSAGSTDKANPRPAPALPAAPVKCIRSRTAKRPRSSVSPRSRGSWISSRSLT